MYVGEVVHGISAVAVPTFSLLFDLHIMIQECHHTCNKHLAELTIATFEFLTNFLAICSSHYALRLCSIHLQCSAYIHVCINHCVKSNWVCSDWGVLSEHIHFDHNDCIEHCERNHTCCTKL